MAWSWSHTAEAYENAKANIQAKPRDWLKEVWAEWQAAIPHEKFGIDFHADLDTPLYDKKLIEAETLTNEQLAEYIWTRTEELRTCTNGGHEAWCCPFGCGCHLVKFDLEPNATLQD